MAKYTDIKAKAQEEYMKLLDDCQVFWAFSNEQFEENKTPLEPGEKYVSIGAGGFMPGRFTQKLMDGMKEIDEREKAAIKQAKAEEVILHELNNYEAFYTGELDDVMEVLGEHYTYEEVKAVYMKYRDQAGDEKRYNEHQLTPGYPIN